MIYVGIDVGGDGGIAAVDREGSVVFKSGIPRIKGDNVIDYLGIVDIFEEVLDLGDRMGVRAVIEDVHSLFGMSAGSNFNFGHIKGFKEGVLKTLGIQYELVPPKMWQKVMWEEGDVVLKENKRTKDTKATSLNAAIRLWPNEDFRKTSRSKVPHDGIIDAALMAEYCRTMEQNGTKKA